MAREEWESERVRATQIIFTVFRMHFTSDKIEMKSDKKSEKKAQHKQTNKQTDASTQIDRIFLATFQFGKKKPLLPKRARNRNVSEQKFACNVWKNARNNNMNRETERVSGTDNERDTWLGLENEVQFACV